MKRSSTIVAVLLLARLSTTPASSESASAATLEETLQVPSLTLTDDPFLAGDTAAGESVMLSGVLRIPKAHGRLPAVILLHGSDGPPGGAMTHWADILSAMGIATFRLNSFGGRGIMEVTKNQARLGYFAQFYVTYCALCAFRRTPSLTQVASQ